MNKVLFASFAVLADFDKAGLHFVYSPYEIACGAIGDVEVVIDLKALCSPVEAQRKCL